MYPNFPTAHLTAHVPSGRSLHIYSSARHAGTDPVNAPKIAFPDDVPVGGISGYIEKFSQFRSTIPFVNTHSTNGVEAQ
jgi:hypothetical protein